MVIGIDIRVLGSKTKSGVEEYTENLLAHMLPISTDIKFKLFYSAFAPKLNTYPWLSLPNVEVHKYNIPNKLLFISANFLNQPHIDTLMGGVDVFFSPHFFLTSLSPPCKHVITFHDLSYVRFPEFFSLRKRLWHSLEMRPRYQSRYSDKIIAVSESTKNDLVSLYKLDPARINVIHSGIAPLFKRPDDVDLESFRIKQNLPKRYILFLGKFEPRKNIPSLIKAFNIIKRESDYKNLHLVLVGARGWLYKEIFQEIDKSEFYKFIKVIDDVEDAKRHYYYSLADVFVYPSFFEGFGFPPLEAMACGTPVIISSSSSLPEVVGAGGIIINPHNIREIASAIAIILNNKSLREDISYEGLCRAKMLNWKITAEKTLEYLVK